MMFFFKLRYQNLGKAEHLSAPIEACSFRKVFFYLSTYKITYKKYGIILREVLSFPLKAKLPVFIVELFA